MTLYVNQKHIVLLFLAVFSLSLTTISLQAYAQPDIRPGCDPEYMDAIEAKAWMHGQRRIAQNKNLILKPDSVLEYSCFYQLIGFLAAEPGTRRFSENFPEYPLWGPISGIAPQSLDQALQETVTEPLLAYLVSFGHRYFGGRAAPQITAPPPYGEYSCDAMQYVWSIARCTNFNQLEDIDGFYDFPWYVANDPRQLPPEHECLPPSQEFVDAIIESYRGEGQDGQHGDEWATFVLVDENDPAVDGVPYEEDPMLTFEIYDRIIAIDCSLSGIIPTGVYIEIPGQSSFEEHFCSRPGCSYDGAGACIQ